ncbi:MAG: spermidine synthase [Myxococcota bacterium]|nr:spermidine synthase [Myxococcota bacterium]
MALPWQTLDHSETTDGTLELRRRGERDFLITLDGRVIMSSAAHRSETVLGELACERCRLKRSPRVLLGGLGMAFTLRAVLDALSPRAKVRVAELHPAVVDWCRGPLAPLTAAAVDDPRVSVELADVAKVVAHAEPASFDAIALDLFQGPRSPRPHDRHYGGAALAQLCRALASDGTLAVWSEQEDPPFARLLAKAGLRVFRQRPGRGGLRHVVYVGVKEEGDRRVRAGGSRDDRRRGRAGRRRS